MQKEKEEIKEILEKLRDIYKADVGILLLIRDKGDQGDSHVAEILNAVSIHSHAELIGGLPKILNNLASDFKSRNIEAGIEEPENARIVSDHSS